MIEKVAMSEYHKYNDPGIYSDLKCIWTISDLIGIKLCDQKFDCENCPLDIILRNVTDKNTNKVKKHYSLKNTEYLDKMLEKIESCGIDNSLIYLKNNWVLKHLYANIYYLGLNPAIVPLLENISGIKEYMKKVYFIKDQKILIVEGEWGNIALPAPINFLLLDKLNWKPEEITACKWIALIAVNQEEIRDSVISTDQWKLDKSILINLISEFKDCCMMIKTEHNSEGSKINYLYRLIGNTEYRKLLNGIFTD